MLAGKLAVTLWTKIRLPAGDPRYRRLLEELEIGRQQSRDTCPERALWSKSFLSRNRTTRGGKLSSFLELSKGTRGCGQSRLGMTAQEGNQQTCHSPPVPPSQSERTVFQSRSWTGMRTLGLPGTPLLLQQDSPGP